MTTTDDVLRSNKAMQVLAATSSAISLVALAIAALSVLNTLAMAVEERTRDIGILAAIGWSRARILALILSEGLLLAGLGGLLGGGLGWLGNHVLNLLVVPGGGMSARATITLTLLTLSASLVSARVVRCGRHGGRPGSILPPPCVGRVRHVIGGFPGLLIRTCLPACTVWPP